MSDRTDAQRLDDLEAELVKLAADNRQLHTRVRRATGIGAAAFILPFAVFALAHIVAVPIGNVRASTLYASKIELREPRGSRATVLVPGVVDVFDDSADLMLDADGDNAWVNVSWKDGRQGKESSQTAYLSAGANAAGLTLETKDEDTNESRATITASSRYIHEEWFTDFAHQYAKYNVRASAGGTSEMEMETGDHQGWKLGTAGGLVDSGTGKPIAP